MNESDALTQGRQAFERRAWREAYEQLRVACENPPIDPADMDRLATAAFLCGQDRDSTDTWARAHREWLAANEPVRAIRCAFWLGFILTDRGDSAQASGWFARAQRLLEDQPDCVERGYLLVPAALRKAIAGEIAEASALFAQAAEIGERFGDRDLSTLGRQGQGRTLMKLGETARGLTLLDEVMVAVTGGEVSPFVVGTIYCSVISACYEIFDLRRAQEWTAALSQWCDSQPELVPYRGYCLVRRAEIMQIHGAWQGAMTETQRACRLLGDPPPGRPAFASALYQLAELHRLRGETDEAEQAYRQASQLGRKPQPGLGLLRLAQGDITAADSSIRRALIETTDRRARSIILAAYVEIMLAAGDISAAEMAAGELEGIAGALDAIYLRALAGQSTGAVLLAKGQASAAVTALRQSAADWREMQAPYQVGRVGLLLSEAYRELGDRDSATLELEAASRILRELGAAPPPARGGENKNAAPSPSRGPSPGTLTPREIELLRLLATGCTNRAIAKTLSISEKTVARHVSNIFTKLDLSSRAAATAYAYQHHLVNPPA